VNNVRLLRILTARCGNPNFGKYCYIKYTFIRIFYPQLINEYCISCHIKFCCTFYDRIVRSYRTQIHYVWIGFILFTYNSENYILFGTYTGTYKYIYIYICIKNVRHWLRCELKRNMWRFFVS